jgi:hypothetical protein
VHVDTHLDVGVHADQRLESRNSSSADDDAMRCA